MASGIKWIKTPASLKTGLRDYQQKVKVAVHAVASYWGQGVQGDTRIRAGWQDRTGNARSGLFYAVDGLGLPTLVGEVSVGGGMQIGADVSVEAGSDNTLIVVVGHTMFYGKFLELGHGGRYAVIMSGIEQNLPQLERLLKNIFEG